MTEKRNKRGNRRKKQDRERPAQAPEDGRLGKGLTRLRLAVVDRIKRLERPLVFAGRLLSAAAVLVLAVAAGRLLEQYVRSAKAFATVEVQVEGLERLKREQVMQQAGLSLGQNVFEVSAEEARRRLGEHPWVGAVEVQRRLPGTYRIHVQERAAVAVLALEQTYLVGDDGTVFKTLEVGDPVDLPVITGLGHNVFEKDAELRASVLVSAVALLHDYRDVGLWRREPIAEIHADSDGGLALYVGSDVTHVRLGRRPFRQKLRRLRGVLDQLENVGNEAAYVYLDNQRRPDRVTVRLR